MFTLNRVIALLCLMACSFYASALTLSGTINSHDPSTITKDGDTYFHFTTGTGIWYSTSTDLVTWTAAASPVFTTYPSWISSKISGFSGSFWAPDVIYMKGYYYLFYSVSSWGTSVSAIGVARTASLKSPSWTDLGIVVESYGGSSEINAIDPALFRDYDGKVYMSYGSFFGGIGVAEINQSTGMLASSVTNIYGGSSAAIEAPYITRNGDYYYLFINRGYCCLGSSSTYYIQVARSSSITGSYTGERAALANESGKYKGPGHIGVLKENGCNYVSTHYYDLNDSGTAKLDILKMTYSSGWPVFTRDFSIASCGGISDGTYYFKARHSGKALTVADKATTNGALVQQYTYNSYMSQKWHVVGHGDGYYSIINANSLLSLDNYGNSTTAGTNIDQWAYWGGTGQQWSFASPATGYYTLTNLLSGYVLDVLNSGTANSVQVIQYPSSGATNQQWSMTRL